MKRVSAYFLLLALLLCSCGQKAPDPYTASDAETLLAAEDLFIEGLAQVNLSVAAALYRIDAAAIQDGVCYMATNTSVSADELTVLILADEEAAAAAEEAFRSRVAAQITVCESYCPAAVPRLESAVVSRIGNTVLLAVGDPDRLPDAVSALRSTN